MSWWQQALLLTPAISLLSAVPNSRKQPANRYRIATANGPALLVVPVKGGRDNRALVEELLVDYTHAWQRQHWRTLFSAYGRAPFFEHFGPQLEALIFADHKQLIDLIMASCSWLSRSMQLELSFDRTDPQKRNESQDNAIIVAKDHTVPYHQVFEARWGFLSDLSAIDLLMNEGPYAGILLRHYELDR